jgi:acetyltransferase-like isoleucine patch superfamily enzyme
MNKTDQDVRNSAEAIFAKNLHITSKIYDWARFASTVSEVWMGIFTFIGDFCFISVPQLMLSDHSQVNSGTRIVGRHSVKIGYSSVVGYGCTLITSSDSTDAEYMNDAAPLEKRNVREGPIELGDRVFIGAHSVIMPNVKIADGAVVRAFSYVNKSLLEEDTIYGGQPAVPIRKRVYTK